MRKLITLVFSPAIFLLMFSCSGTNRLAESNYIVTPLSEKASLTEGSLVYGLPLTVVDITLETERIIEKPGPYARYAEDLLGLKDVIRSENEYWLIRSVTIQTHEELDPAGLYVVEAPGLFHTNALSLKKAGLILDLNPEMYNSIDARRTAYESDIDQFRISDLGADEYFQVRRDTAYRLVNLDTAFIRIPYLIEKKQKLSSDQLADRAARRLLEMRDGKHMILTGEANVFPQHDAAIREMNRLEKEYTELFTGKSWSERRVFTYQIIPGREMTSKAVNLIRFSEVMGPSKASDQAGTPINIEFIPENKTVNIPAFTQSRKEPASKYGKIVYRVPDVVNVRVTLGDENLASSRELIYQLGTLVQLPSNYIIGK